MSVTPAPHGLSSAKETAISVTFNRPVDPSTVDAASFWAYGRFSGPAVGPYSFSNDGATVTLKLASSFAPGERVTVVLSNEISDLGGGRLRAAGFSYRFWTASAPTEMVFEPVEDLVFGAGERPDTGLAANLDGDRYPDLVAVSGAGDVRVFLNRRDGSYGPSLTPESVGELPSPSESADFNRDGHVDLCVANAGSDSVSVLLGNGDGTFGLAGEIYLSAPVTGIAVLDADGDGDLDIAAAGGPVHLLLNDGQGSFGAPLRLGVDGGRAIAAADMNNDGIMDLVLGEDRKRRVAVLRGNGNPEEFALQGTLTSALGRLTSIATGDVDRDGDADVVTTSRLAGSEAGAIFTNAGDGSLSPPRLYCDHAKSCAVEVDNGGATRGRLADLDGDGDLDWAVARRSSDLALFENAGDGSFSLNQTLATPRGAADSVLFDMNGDDRLDVAIVDSGDDRLRVLHSLGPTPPWTLTVDKQGPGEGTITSDPAGINCGSGGFDCSEDYADQTVVTLTATPDFGSGVGDLSGDADCSDGVVTMTTDVHCIFAFTNEEPLVTISAPLNDSIHVEGMSIDFIGTATDTEDGVLSGSLGWSSSIDGAIGAGGTFQTTLSGGVHQIDASVTDAGGMTGSASINLIVNGDPGTLVSKKIHASDPGFNDAFGSASDVSGDTVAIGAESSPAVYIFERDEGGAAQWGEVRKVVPNIGTAPNFGRSLELQGDRLVVGADNYSPGGLIIRAGGAFVFERNEGGPGNWGEVAELTASDGAMDDELGWSCAIDGDTAVVGTRFHDGAADDAGAAYIFERNEGGVGNWGELKKLTASDAAADDRFGVSTALDGDTLAVGAYYDDSITGAAYVFYRDQGGTDNWGEVKKVVASDGATDDRYGISVDLDGDTLVVGSYHDDGRIGAVYIYERDLGGPDNWGERKKIISSDPDVFDQFGWQVRLDGDQLLVGARLDDTAEDNSGVAYLFERNQDGPNEWGEVVRIEASDPGMGDEFGWAVGIEGSTLAIGAPNDDDTESGSGSAYVFERIPAGNTAPSVNITVPTDGSTFPEGTSIAFSGTASDTQDGDLTSSLLWYSDIDGMIGTGNVFQIVLSLGTHTITASVRDSGGLASEDEITVTVNPVWDLTIVNAGFGSGHVTSAPPGIDCGTQGSDCVEGYVEGTMVTLTPTPSPDSSFAGWSGDPACGGVVNMTTDTTCTATFDLAQDLSFSDTTFSGESNFSACNCITLGPNVTVTGTGILTLTAGVCIVLEDEVEVDLDGVLNLEIDPNLCS